MASSYTWQWLWSENDSLMREGMIKHRNEQVCRENAARCKPSYDTWNGPDAPYAKLNIISYDADGDILEHPAVDYYSLELGKNRGAHVTDVRARMLWRADLPRIDIRKWRHSYCGSFLPGKNGLSLSLQRWMLLKALNLTEQIKCARQDKTIKTERVHVGGMLYASISAPHQHIHLRDWCQEDGMMKPGSQGITLTFEQWEALIKHSKELTEDMSDRDLYMYEYLEQEQKSCGCF